MSAMNSSKGYYSLIQYCPDLARLEAANIGVVLFCPELKFLQAKTSPGHDRIRRFFGSEDNDWEAIQTLKYSLEHRLEVGGGDIQTPEEFQKFVDTRGNALQLTPPRPMRVVDPVRDLNDLFDQLVGQRQRTVLVDKPTPIKRLLDETFRREKLGGFLRTKLRVAVPSTNIELEIPYGFQNGIFNLIQPVKFAATRRELIEEQASKHSVRGEMLKRENHPQFGQLDLIVVGSFSNQAETHRRMVEEILRANRVTLFTSETMPALVEKIRTTGKLVPLQNQ